MSNRDSLGFGELLPQDVVDIFAQEKHSKGSRKKRSRSLGRALGWLKGKKRKDLGTKGKNLGLGPALDLALDGNPAGHQGGHKGGLRSGRQAHPQGNSHAVLKQDDDKTPAPPLFQENVFVETDRPKYLEDLHTEAQEGLKMMQQEENNHGVEYQDNESTISTATVQTDGEGGGFVTDSTIADTSSVVSVQSSVSTRSSRSGLTRQGSTFRPLNSGKKSEKTRTRKKHRTTVAGIPQHVQRELGLDRVGWILSQKVDEGQHYNGESAYSPTTDGPQQAAESQKGASASLQAMNAIHPLSKVEQLTATLAGHGDDLALLQPLGRDLEDGDRPRSLAVPWMTTGSSLQQEPPSPVITMSPQAAYMSKIIPNAVLPPSIDVVEINRGRSRNSVRTVSKSSLLLSSPTPSRASSRASSSRTTSSRASTVTSASRHNLRSVSDTSCWSNSDSSETLVSDSSTISRSSTPRQKRSQDGDASAKEDKISVHSSISKASKCTSNGKLVAKGNQVKKEGQFVRSLSVMKSKRAPPPPSRSYSLHNKMKRRSRDLAEVLIIAGEPVENENHILGSSPKPSRTVESPGYNADTSSLEDSTGSVSFSPNKGLQVLKTGDDKKDAETKDASQEKQELLQENKLNKMISPSSGYSSQDATSPQLSKQPHSSSPRHKKGILAKLQRLFPGSTSAGSAAFSPIQPEAPENTKCTGGPPSDSVDTVSVSPSVRTLRELFNIPPPPKVHAPPPPPPEVWAHNKRTFELLLGPPAPDNINAIIKKNPKDRRQQRHSPSVSSEGSVKSLVVERKHKNPAVPVESVHGSLRVLDAKKVQESGILNAEVHNENNERLTQNVDLKENRKDEKVRVSDILNGMLVKAVEKREERLAAIREEEIKKTSTHATEVITNMDTLPAISLVRISPSPSPTLVHHPPKPIATQTTLVQVAVSPESLWPPPPPPMVQSGIIRQDETDFPLPPPPLFREEGLVLPVQIPPKNSILDGDSSRTTASVMSVAKTESVEVVIEAEPQKPSTAQEMAPPPLNIPPPPPYTAPPPPIPAVLSSSTNDVSLSPKEVSPPPPPPFEVLPVRLKESSAPVVRDVLPPVTDISPTLITVVPPPPVTDISPTLITVVPPPPVTDISPTLITVVPPPPVTDISPTLITVVPPPPVTDISPTLITVVPPPPVTDISPTLITVVPPPPVTDISPTLMTVVPPPPVKEVSLPLVSEVSPLPPKEVPALSPEEVPPPPFQDDVSQSSKEATPVDKFTPPQSIPPPPSLPSEQEIDSILTPPQSIPPPPPIELLHQLQVPPKNDGPDQGPANIRHLHSPLSTENQSQEQASTPVVQEEPTPIVTPTLLQMVKLRSVNSSPEPLKAQEQPQAEVTMRKQPSSQVPTSPTSGDAPQKPIRKSLILTSPTSTSPPAIVTSQPTLPKSQSVVIPPASSSTLSPIKKSPPATTPAPSMNLQEAIRLRTAARSKESPASRLSLHSPTSPMDFHKSPTSTASFIFSKSNKKVVIETKSMLDTTEAIPKNLEVSSITKVIGEAESLKKGVKVPPPVAKKPKSKGKEAETCEGTEQTAGQEAQQGSIKDTADQTNGTAGTVEGGGTSST